MAIVQIILVFTFLYILYRIYKSLIIKEEKQKAKNKANNKLNDLLNDEEVEKINLKSAKKQNDIDEIINKRNKA